MVPLQRCTGRIAHIIVQEQEKEKEGYRWGSVSTDNIRQPWWPANCCCSYPDEYHLTIITLYKLLALKPLNYNQESTNRNQETRMDFGQLITNVTALHLVLSPCGIKISSEFRNTAGDCECAIPVVLKSSMLNLRFWIRSWKWALWEIGFVYLVVQSIMGSRDMGTHGLGISTRDCKISTRYPESSTLDLNQTQTPPFHGMRPMEWNQLLQWNIALSAIARGWWEVVFFIDLVWRQLVCQVCQCVWCTNIQCLAVEARVQCSWWMNWCVMGGW